MDHFRNSRNERCHCDSSTNSRNAHDVIHVRGSARILIGQIFIRDFFNEKEFNPDEAVVFGVTVQAATSNGCIDNRNAHDVVFVGPIVQRMFQFFSIGTDPSTQTKRTLRDATVFTHMKMRHKLAAQPDSQTRFSEIFVTGRAGHAECTNERSLTVALRNSSGSIF